MMTVVSGSKRQKAVGRKGCQVKGEKEAVTMYL